MNDESNSEATAENDVVDEVNTDAEVDNDFQVVLKGPGFSLDRNVDQNVAAAITSLILGGAQLFPSPAGPSGTNHSPAAPAPIAQTGTPRPVHNGPITNLDQTLGEYLHEVEPKTAPDKIAAVGEFLYLYSQQQDFSPDDFREQLESIRDTIPGNIPRDFKTALQQRLIAKSTGDPKRYYVTGTGREAIANKFSKVGKKK